jgi:predicted transcriptional regulator
MLPAITGAAALLERLEVLEELAVQAELELLAELAVQEETVQPEDLVELAELVALERLAVQAVQELLELQVQAVGTHLQQIQIPMFIYI